MTFERVVEIRVENEPLETDMRKKRENCPKRETPCLALLPGNCDGGPTYMQGPFFFHVQESKKSESTAKTTGQRFGNTCDEA